MGTSGMVMTGSASESRNTSNPRGRGGEPILFIQSIQTMEFKTYRRKPSPVEARQVQPDETAEDLREQYPGISISDNDLNSGHPKAGDMVVRDPKNPNDYWLVRQEYWERKYEGSPV